MPYKLGSLFDGSGGFPLSGSLCGIEPKWAAEVEPYPIAVTRTRFPNMRHLGDISKVNGADIEPVDIITFGSPCQDLSVAGKRAGLKHEANGDDETTRSGLFMEAVRIIKEMREATNGVYPRFALWENVPGAFSSNKGEDFRIVCEELIKVVEPSASMPSVPQKGWAYADSYIGDGWSLAYRVFDAQYWGVPQRRRRIHLVVDFRGTSAREVLFEREGVRGYFTQGRTPWQAAPSDAQDRPAADDREGEGLDGAGGERGRLDAVGFMRQLSGVEAQNEVSPTILAAAGESGNNKPCVAYTMKIRSGVEVDANGKGAGKGPLVQVDKSATLSTVQDQYLFAPVCMATQQGGAEIRTDDKAPTVTAAAGMSGNNQPIVTYSFDSLASNSMKSSNPHSGCRAVEVAKTLDTTDPSPNKNQGGIAVVEATPIHDQATRFSGKRGDKVDGKGNGLGVGKPGDPMNTLTAGDRHAVVYSASKNSHFTRGVLNVASTLVASDYKDLQLIGYAEKEVRYIVRRLTPTECARLQGFADRWGDIEKKDEVNFIMEPEEYEFWLNVRNTHAAINGKKVQDYTEAQMATWYNKLQSDANEYKMWGNGIALPPALYCMQGIVDALNKEEEDDWLL